MRLIKIVLALGVVLGLSACATVDTASRGVMTPVPAPMDAGTESLGLSANQFAANPAANLYEPYHVVGVTVTVPQTLKVSEANSFKPRADIVWREDPLGDRYEQVRVIMQNAVEQGAAPYAAGREVKVLVEMTQFHALTQRTRYTIGGKHEIGFFMEVVDAQTGATLQPRRHVYGEFDALGGAAAIEAMSRGETQKFRITHFVKELVTQELAKRYIAPQAPTDEPMLLGELVLPLN